MRHVDAASRISKQPAALDFSTALPSTEGMKSRVIADGPGKTFALVVEPGEEVHVRLGGRYEEQGRRAGTSASSHARSVSLRVPDRRGRFRCGRLGPSGFIVACFALAWWRRGGAAIQPDAVVLGLEAIGLGLLGTGAYMGGTLVTRNFIGVDHRYAQAGKWREQTIDGPPNRAVAVAKHDELKVDQMKLLRAGTKRIVLARTPSGYVAFDDRCTHRGGSLAGGVMVCGTVQCLWHGSQFDASSGQVKAGPATRRFVCIR
jgi:nitrite reductase/ring-hydroxylating ferredoxin subunit